MFSVADILDFCIPNTIDCLNRTLEAIWFAARSWTGGWNYLILTDGICRHVIILIQLGCWWLEMLQRRVYPLSPLLLFDDLRHCAIDSTWTYSWWQFISYFDLLCVRACIDLFLVFLVQFSWVLTTLMEISISMWATTLIVGRERRTCCRSYEQSELLTWLVGYEMIVICYVWLVNRSEKLWSSGITHK
jgi:hypothetical protein